MSETISARDARRLFLDAQGLFADPARTATPAVVRRLVTKLGFVQLDSINTVARAHDLILFSRLEGYRPTALTRMLEKERSLFEGWTHDASAIPTAWYRHWKPRFVRDRARIESHAWWQRLLGPNRRRITARVAARITAEGPLGAADFERTTRAGTWWDWSPEKAALDYLWRTGELAIAGRRGFQKLYDLPARVLAGHHEAAAPSAAEHVAWACETAAERLVVFSPSELARYWGAIAIADARAWCAAETAAGRLRTVGVESASREPPRPAYAVADWHARLARLGDPPARIRMLAPFDPIVRDRARCLARFGFDYRFEAFTPAAKRRYGYYVMPLLEGDALVGRLEPKLHREARRLELRGVFWERGAKETKERKRALTDALERLATFVGATTIDRAPSPRT